MSEHRVQVGRQFDQRRLRNLGLIVIVTHAQLDRVYMKCLRDDRLSEDDEYFECRTECFINTVIVITHTHTRATQIF